MPKISDTINQMIQRILESAEFTSASPTHINRLIQVNEQDNPDLEEEIKQLLKEEKGKASAPTEEETENIKQSKAVTLSTKKIKRFEDGNIGELNRFTSEQFGNIKEFALDPGGFFIRAFISKFAKGVGIFLLVQIIAEAVKFIINELHKPGRTEDVRFKLNWANAMLSFQSREQQAKLRQGFSSIIITSSQNMRPTSGSQITNTLNMVGGRQKWPVGIWESPLTYLSTGVSISKASGRRGLRADGFR